ncbi:MAG: ABC transporter ATP-binding protein [Eubacteriaceae bacterium]
MTNKKSYDSLNNIPRFSKAGGGGQHNRFIPVKKPNNIKSTLKRLTKIYMNWHRSIILIGVLTVLSSVVVLFTPYLIGMAINTFDINSNIVDYQVLKIVLLSLIACYISSWLINTLNGILVTTITQKLIKYIRCQFFLKMQKIPLVFYDNRSHGDIMSRITNDVDNISKTIAQATTQMISSFFSILGAFVMMFILSPILTLITIVTIPLIFLLTKTITKRSYNHYSNQQRTLGSLNSLIEENILGLKIVKAFNKQKNVLSNFKNINQQLCNYSIKAQIWSGFLMPLMNVINNLSFSLIACAGGILSVKNIISIGTVVSFLTYSKQFSHPLNNIANIYNSLQSALAGAERIFEIYDEKEEPPDKKDAKELKNIRGDVEFKNVYFSYTKDTPVLKNISLKVNSGETIALVGETGAGKTTLVNLLTGFYEISNGEIIIDNNNITNISRESLRKCFSVVLQDTFLFSDTIYNNIRYSKPMATNEEVIAAAKLARADKFINRLPKGYNTLISGTTDNLSEGQRQLLAIARAILCNAPILILDEATSSVDTKTEKEIQKALLTLMKNHTSFLIAHRLSTIKDADRIIVIENGEIIETGTHVELMNNRKNYYKMVISQMGCDINL